LQAHPGDLLQVLFLEIQESPQALPVVQVLQHVRDGCGGLVGGEMTRIGVLVGIGVGPSVNVSVGEGVNVGGIGVGVGVGSSRVGVSGTTRVFVAGMGVGV
jgi:hypothetical protein